MCCAAARTVTRVLIPACLALLWLRVDGTIRRVEGELRVLEQRRS